MILVLLMLTSWRIRSSTVVVLGAQQRNWLWSVFLQWIRTILNQSLYLDFSRSYYYFCLRIALVSLKSLGRSAQIRQIALKKATACSKAFYQLEPGIQCSTINSPRKRISLVIFFLPGLTSPSTQRNFMRVIKSKSSFLVAKPSQYCLQSSPTKARICLQSSERRTQIFKEFFIYTQNNPELLSFKFDFFKLWPITLPSPPQELQNFWSWNSVQLLTKWMSSWCPLNQKLPVILSWTNCLD